MKDPIERMERWATDWEKIFAKHMSNKGLVLRIYKELSNSTSEKKKKIQLEDGQNDMNRYFTQKDIQISSKYIKFFPISLAIIQEMKTKTTVTYPSESLKWKKIVTPPNVGEDLEKSSHSYVACCCLVINSCPTHLRPHGLQHTRLPCPSPSPGVCASSCPLHRCHPTISSSVAPWWLRW